MTQPTPTPTKFRLNQHQFLHDRYAAVLRRLASDEYPVMITADFEHDDFGPSTACFDEKGNWDGRVCCTIFFADLHVPSRDFVLCSRHLIEESPIYDAVWGQAVIAGHLQQFLEFSVMIDNVHKDYWKKAVRREPLATRVDFLRQSGSVGWRLRLVIHAATVDRCVQREFAMALATEEGK